MSRGDARHAKTRGGGGVTELETPTRLVSRMIGRVIGVALVALVVLGVLFLATVMARLIIALVTGSAC